MRTAKSLPWETHYRATLSTSMTRSGESVLHLRVERRSGRDGIAWDVLQRIKDDVLGPEVLAVEVYPPRDEVVNEINARHLWTVPPSIESEIPSLMRRGGR